MPPLIGVGKYLHPTTPLPVFYHQDTDEVSRPPVRSNDLSVFQPDFSKPQVKFRYPTIMHHEEEKIPFSKHFF